ncbi:13572_t:CDS:2, partial [Acaulospora colombiana]
CEKFAFGFELFGEKVENEALERFMEVLVMISDVRIDQDFGVSLNYDAILRRIRSTSEARPPEVPNETVHILVPGWFGEHTPPQ